MVPEKYLLSAMHQLYSLLRDHNAQVTVALHALKIVFIDIEYLYIL